MDRTCTGQIVFSSGIIYIEVAELVDAKVKPL